MTPPCGVPASGRESFPDSNTPAFSHLPMSRRSTPRVPCGRASAGAARGRGSPAPDALNVPAESRTSSRESPARKQLRAPSLLRAEGPCPRRLGCRWADVIAFSGICFASVAIRSSFVEMVMELDVSVIVPSIGSASRKLLPSTGSLGSVPPLHRYYELLGRPPPFAYCRADYARCRASFPSLGATTRDGGGGGFSQVPGEPSRSRRVLRPRQEREPGHSGRALLIGSTLLPSVASTTSAPVNSCLTGLIRTARSFAVYASSPGSSSVATQDSLPAGGPPWPVGI
jgi:hypothetical protein